LASGSNRGKADGAHGDQVFIQGHASPGIYARAFLEGRLGEADLDRYRREVGGGLPSFPHPRRSDFWEFPTASMGLGLINAAYQARFNRYLGDRGIVDTGGATVWCFAGDGEMDRLRPTEAPRRSHLAEVFDTVDGPVVAVTDFVKGGTRPDRPLGSPTVRPARHRRLRPLRRPRPLRRHFEVDAAHIVVAALHGLAERGEVKAQVVAAAIERCGIDNEAPDPRYA
jgi:pyruvate dehydrogenase complex dehydrogenase (E1) component